MTMSMTMTMTMSMNAAFIVIALMIISQLNAIKVEGFVSTSTCTCIPGISSFLSSKNRKLYPLLQSSSNSNDWSSSGAGSSSNSQGKLVELEYKIYPGGRVEEIVTGVKGGECHKITSDIESALGDVVATEPTEEMYENEIDLTNKEVLKNTNGWEDSGSGGQFSSW